ncbi:hypothetical protein TNCV_1074811 [Trichonephila clavipes]|uniref:Uncharacterized protein n=1 Tax=Trichonephila clavipes TaxID=2585209 RepID=A0A8X6ST28_TRICX|nr:hypothetical protein TNCV_1074811 [Trichonephila clavipes]
MLLLPNGDNIYSEYVGNPKTGQDCLNVFVKEQCRLRLQRLGGGNGSEFVVVLKLLVSKNELQVLEQMRILVSENVSWRRMEFFGEVFGINLLKETDFMGMMLAKIVKI